jgi:uncharacterized membrane protein
MNNRLKLSIFTEIIPVVLIILSFILGTYFYSHFPALVASHWNWSGQPDRYSGKFSGAFLLPLIMLGLYILLTALPYLDPKADRYPSFSKVYLIIRNLILLLMLLIFAATGANNLGYDLSIKFVTAVLLGIFFIILGNFMGKIKSNWFVGIRNPWTLSSENVWNKTHRFGGFMMVLMGALILISPLLPGAFSLGAIILGLILVVVVTNIYSYIIYQREKNVRLN